MRFTLSFAAAFLAAPLAAAQPVNEATNVAEPAPPPGTHQHGGFYLRLATGFGSHSGDITLEGESHGTHVSGVSGVGELAIGGAIASGVMVGAGIYTSSLLASDRIVHGTTPPPDVIDRGNDFSLIGPFVDWYPNPRQGLHLQGAVGLVTVRRGDFTEGDIDDEIAIGAGVMLGFGHEWWVSDQWSFGILGRITAGMAVGDDSTGAQWTYGVGVSPSILFTATYN